MVAKFVKRDFRKIRTSARIAVLAIIGISVTLGAPIANGLGSAKPTLIEDKLTETWLWCDSNNDGFVNFADVQQAVFTFSGFFGLGLPMPNTSVGTDFVGARGVCRPDQITNANDIQAVVSAFTLQSYAERLDATGKCAGNGATCTVSLQDCADLSTCEPVCTLPCAP